MAIIDQAPTATAAGSQPNLRDDEPSMSQPKIMLANIVDVLDDSHSTTSRHQSELELREPTTFQEKQNLLPILPHPSQGPRPPFRGNPAFHNRQMPSLQPQQHSQRSLFAPWQPTPFQAPFRNVVPTHLNPQQQQQPFAAHPYPTNLIPAHRNPMLNGSLNNSHYARCDSPLFAEHSGMGGNIPATASFASHENTSSDTPFGYSTRVISGPPGSSLPDNVYKVQQVEPEGHSSKPGAPMSPRLGRDMEGKTLVIAVSESPTECARRQLAPMDVTDNDREVKPAPAPDSPGPAFLTLMNEMYNSDELKIGNLGDFELLPCLDDEDGKARVSPPMMPFLSQSPQLSWEVDSPLPNPKSLITTLDANGSFLNAPGGSNGQMHQRKRSLTLKPKSDLTTFGDSGQGTMSDSPASFCQPLFQEQAITHGNLLNQDSFAQSMRSAPPTSPPPYHANNQPMMQMQQCLSRDEIESNRTEVDGQRDNAKAGGIFSKRRCPPQLSRGSFPAVSQSFSYSPVPPPRAVVRPALHFTPPRPPIGFSGRPGMESQPMPQRLPQMPMQNSKGKCAALSHPVPTKFQGDMEQAMNQPLPDFSSLVNYPNSLRQTRTLPSGMRCCVMCGTVRPTCSRARNRNKNLPHMKHQFQDYSGGDDFVTIPTQNKGLCTICDISVWVVRDSGCQIKWCKGCKNFRQWAFFGEKGLATKCGRCRERQREKYAKMKDSKKREQEQKRRHQMK